MTLITQTINDTKKKQEDSLLYNEFKIKIEGLALMESESNLFNSRLIHKQTLMKISKNNVQERTLFLFDKMLVYCKENPVKKGFYMIKGKIPLCKLAVEDMPIGSTVNGVNYDYIWTVKRTGEKDAKKDKCYYFVVKSGIEKLNWLNNIRKAKEIIDLDQF